MIWKNHVYSKMCKIEMENFQRENRDVEMGYYFGSDGGQKVKLIQYQ